MTELKLELLKIKHARALVNIHALATHKTSGYFRKIEEENAKALEIENIIEEEAKGVEESWWKNIG